MPHLGPRAGPAAPAARDTQRGATRGGRGGGKITRVGAFDDAPSRGLLLDAGDLIVMPGLVDTHVHVNEPGRTDWEGFETATRAAVAGGVTTVLDMPLNSIPATTSVAFAGP